MQRSERSTRSSNKLVSDQPPPPSSDDQSDTGQYMCIECSETFDTRLELNSHRQSHVTRKQYTCRQCGRGFHHQVFLQMHERSHEGGVSSASMRQPPVRVISTRSSKVSDVVTVKPTYTKPPRVLNSIVEFKNEQKVCQTFTPKEFVTRRTRCTSSAVSQRNDVPEDKNIFELRISKYSDTTVHLMDSFGNSIEILADVFNTYTIGEPEENGVAVAETLTKTYEKSPLRIPSDERSSESLTEVPSVSPQTKDPKPLQLDGEIDNINSSNPEFITKQSITSKELNDSGLSVPAPVSTESEASSEHEQMERQPSSDVIGTSDKESLPSFCVNEDNVNHDDADELHIASSLPDEDRMDTSPEDAACPTSPVELQNPPETLSEDDEAAQTTLITSTADEPIDDTENKDKDTSSIVLPLKPPNITKDQPLLGHSGSLIDASESVPKITDEKHPDCIVEEQEQDQHKALNKPDSEIEQNVSPVDSPPEEPSLALPFIVPVPCNPPLVVHEPSSKEELCNTLPINRDNLSTENQPKSSEGLGTQNKEAALTPSAAECSEGIGDKVMPEKPILQPASKENADKKDNMETDRIMTSQDAGEVSEEEVCLPGTTLQVDNKDPEKPCSLLPDQDMLHDEKLAVDDKRDDLFERDIFPLETQLKVCEKGLTSMEDEQNIVSRGEIQRTKMIQEKESDICLNDSDMTYISESEMIRLLEQDKDEPTDNEPLTINQKVLENIEEPKMDIAEASSEPAPSNSTQETKSSKSPINRDGEPMSCDGVISRKPRELPTSLEEGTPEAHDYQLKRTDVTLTSETRIINEKPAFQDTSEEKSNTGFCLPESLSTTDEPTTGDMEPLLTTDQPRTGDIELLPDKPRTGGNQPLLNTGESRTGDVELLLNTKKPTTGDIKILNTDEPRTEDIEPQGSVECMLIQVSESKNTIEENQSLIETSSNSESQPMTKEDDPEKQQPDQGLQLGDQDDQLCGRTELVIPEPVIPEENTDVLVTVDDKENKDRAMQQSDPIKSSLLKEKVESGSEKPSTSMTVHKDPIIDTVCSTKPDKTLESVNQTLPAPQEVASDPKPLLLQENIGNQESIFKPKNAEHETPALEVSHDIGSDTTAESSEITDLFNKAPQDKRVKDTTLLLENKKNDDYEETDIITEDKTVDQSSDLSKTLHTTENIDAKANYCDLNISGKETQNPELVELVANNTNQESQEDNSIIKDVQDLAKPNDDLPQVSAKVEDDTPKVSDVSSEDHTVIQGKIQDSLEDSELMENENQEDADSFDMLSKSLSTSGRCLKCGRRLRRGRKELTLLPVCFKCRMAAKKKEHVSNQAMTEELDLALETPTDRKDKSLSAEVPKAKLDGESLLQDISKKPTAIPDQLVDKKEDSDTSTKKKYKCPKCGEAFKIPALLGRHMRSHTLPKCLTCGCQMRLRYKIKRLPKRCQKCLQKLKEMRAKEKAKDESGEEGSGSSGNEDVEISLKNDDVSDKDTSVAIKDEKISSKAEMPGSYDPIPKDDLSVQRKSPVSRPPDEDAESSDELDASDYNLGQSDGEKPRLCPQCGRAFKCYRSLNLHLLSHSAMQCESCGSRLAKRRKIGRVSKKCWSCRHQIKSKPFNDGGDEGQSSDKSSKQKNVACLRLKSKQSKMQSIIKKKKELKWMNMLLAVKGLMDKSKKKKEDALQAAKKDGESSEAEKCDESSAENISIHPDSPKPDLPNPIILKADSAKLPCPPHKALSGTPKPGHKENIIKVENEDLPCIPSDDSISTTFIKEEETFQCLECSLSWPNAEALISHQNSHISGQPIICPQCPQVFSSEQYLNVHIHAHDVKRPYRCPECDKTFTKLNHLNLHMRVHMGSRRFACPDCPCRFRQKGSLIAHRYSHRNYQLLFAKPFQCSVCSKSFKQKERLVVHERLHTGECPFSCKDCGKGFISKARLYAHRKLHKISASSSCETNVGSKEVVEGQPLKCQDCGKVCTTNASFALHRKVHRLATIPVQDIKHEENEEVHPFRCIECNKVFASKATLAMHLKNHSAHRATAKPEKTLDDREHFPCKDCDKVCFTKASFVLHRKVHKSPSAGQENLVIKEESDTPKYVCKDCNKACSTKASLVLHCKVHTNQTGTETPSFKCKRCDLVCTTKASFVLHKKVHRSLPSNQQSPKSDAEPKSYSCKHCDMVCTTKASFVLHKKVHRSLSSDQQSPKSKEEPQSYSCKHCDMVCTTKASFVLHKKVHRSLPSNQQSLKSNAEPQSFSCTHCDMVCTTKASFVLHQKVHSNQQSPKSNAEPQSYSCKHCDMVFTTKAIFVQHKKKVHRSLPSNQQSPKSNAEPQSYRCKHCDMVCTTKAIFVQHKRKMHRSLPSNQQSPKSKSEPQSYSCKHCDMVCTTKASFALHSKVHRSPSISEQILKTNAEAQSFKCEHCDMVCSTKASFAIHSKVHRSADSKQSPKVAEGAQTYSCKHCDMVCTTKASFALHSKVHRSLFDDEHSPETSEEPRSYSCKHCDMLFSTKASLVLHRKVHRSLSITKQVSKATDDPQSYNCNECAMVCSTKASFVLHSRVHKIGQDPKADIEKNNYTCKDCNKVCSTKASFFLHRKVHKSSSDESKVGPKGDGEEPSYQCKDCGKNFSSKGRLDAHSKLHVESTSEPSDPNTDNKNNTEQPKKEKPYCCPTCGLRFVKLKVFIRHKATHGERTMTPCIHCGKEFLYMKSLLSHFKICQSKGKKLLKKATMKRKVPKDGGSTSSDSDSVQKKRKIDEKQKALTATQKLKNKNLIVKAKQAVKSKDKLKGAGEKRVKVESEVKSEGEGKKSSAEKQSDVKAEKSSEQASKDPTPKKSLAKIKKGLPKDKTQKLAGPKKWHVLAASSVKKKNLQAIIGGKKKLLLKKKVLMKAKSGAKASKD